MKSEDKLQERGRTNAYTLNIVATQTSSYATGGREGGREGHNRSITYVHVIVTWYH